MYISLNNLLNAGLIKNGRYLCHINIFSQMRVIKAKTRTHVLLLG